MRIKILGIHGSPRKGATAYALERALEAAREVPGVETEFLELRGRELHPCIHCNRCVKPGNFTCPAFAGDGMEEFYEKIPQADGLILATPVYEMGPSAQMQIFLNRLRPLGKLTSKGGWSLKVGCGIAVGGARNGGEETTLDALNRYFFAQGMCMAGAGVYAYNGGSIWSKDRLAKGASEDVVGLRTVGMAARRMAVTALLLKAGREALPELSP